MNKNEQMVVPPSLSAGRSSCTSWKFCMLGAPVNAVAFFHDCARTILYSAWWKAFLKQECANIIEHVNGDSKHSGVLRP